MGAVSGSKYVVNAGWADVPHLDTATVTEMLAATPRHLRNARSKGEASLGAGAIFPYEQEQIEVAPFALPPHWPRAYGLDVGWNRTACIWGAWDRESDVVYLYSEHYLGEEKPVTHAAAIKARGDWIPGVIDPAARGRAQKDGEQLLFTYQNEGLDLHAAINTVETGIYEVDQRLQQGRIKVFSNLGNWFAEQRLYHRDEKGAIVKKRDHLMDASRYLIMSGLKRAITRPANTTMQSRDIAADSRAGY